MSAFGKTLWTSPEKKFRPRNMQAARVMFPARGIHQPPPEPTESKADRDAKKEKDSFEAKRQLAIKLAQNEADELAMKNRQDEENQARLNRKNARWEKSHNRRVKKLRKKMNRKSRY